MNIGKVTSPSGLVHPIVVVQQKEEEGGICYCGHQMKSHHRKIGILGLPIGRTKCLSRSKNKKGNSMRCDCKRFEDKAAWPRRYYLPGRKKEAE